MTSGARLPGKVVPWASQEEWEYAMSLLFSENEDEVKKGYCFVRMWAHRGRIPTAVEATGNLSILKFKLQRSLSDAHDSAEHDHDEEPHLLQLSITMALVRFVNEMVDPGQKGSYAQPITRLAEQIGLPRNLVDLRHSGTHDELPSLGVLELAIEQSLAWLRQNYWEPTKNWRVTFKSRCDEMIKRIYEELGELEEKLSPEDHKSNDQILQRKMKIIKKALNSIEHLQLSKVLQREFSSFLKTVSDTSLVEMITDCMNDWTQGSFKSQVPITIAPSEDILDETEVLLKKLAERKRLKLEQSTSITDGWHEALNWVPCDLGCNIDYRRHV